MEEGGTPQCYNEIKKPSADRVKIGPKLFLCAYIKSCFCPVFTCFCPVFTCLSKSSVWLKKLFVNILLTMKARDTIQTVLRSA